MTLEGSSNIFVGQPRRLDIEHSSEVLNHWGDYERWQD
jgi:hypothetical protein